VREAHPAVPENDGPMRGTSWLTVDLGNSRYKLRSWCVPGQGAPRIDGAAELEGEERLAERLADWLRGRRTPGQAVLSSVASPELEGRVRGVLAASAGRFLDAPDCGLEVLCRVPEEVGRDRLYAARGALHHLDRSCVVVDAGTALTVDALVRRKGGGGTFLGGAIAPGPGLLAEALGRRAARLPEITPGPEIRSLGRDTREALRAGIGVGFRGAARELIAGVAREADLVGAPVVLTGGARNFLLEPEPITVLGLVVLAEAVHLGLLAAGLDRAGAPGPPAPPDPGGPPGTP